MSKMPMATAALLLLASSPALAEEGHFILGGNNAPVCTDVGTTVLCEGKVAGLDGTTFEIIVEAEGVAEVECRNFGGNVAPGQDTSVTATGTTGPVPTPRNGNYDFEVETLPTTVPVTPTCPNNRWTPEIVDVVFGSAILSLFEDNVLVDEVEVLVLEED